MQSGIPQADAGLADPWEGGQLIKDKISSVNLRWVHDKPRCMVPLSTPPLMKESWSPIFIIYALSRCLTYRQTLSGIKTCRAVIGCDTRQLMLLKSVWPVSITPLVPAASSAVRGSYIMYRKSYMYIRLE